jgi:hypothetical protein
MAVKAAQPRWMISNEISNDMPRLHITLDEIQCNGNIWRCRGMIDRSHWISSNRIANRAFNPVFTLDFVQCEHLTTYTHHQNRKLYPT